MRITERSRTAMLLRNLQTASTNMSRLYDKLATQKEVNLPSDSPSATGTIMRMNAYIDALEQTRDAVSTAQSFVNTVTDTLETSAETLLSAKILASRALNGALSPSELQAISGEMNQLLESAIQQAGQSFDGRYLFSGNKTDTVPFSITRDANGKIETITYQGSSNMVEFPIGRGRTLAGSVAGDTAFDETGFFEGIQSLRDVLWNAAGMSESERTEAIQAGFATLSRAEADFRALVGQVGARSAELDMVTQQTEGSLTRAKEALSNVQDVDMAELALALQTEQVVYEALLAVSARIMNISLMDYL